MWYKNVFLLDTQGHVSVKDLRTKVTRPFKHPRMTTTAVVMETIQFRFSDNTGFEIS